MQRLFFLLIASALVTMATIHALELPGSVTVECSGAVHQDGDADQSQGDADKAIPHHHGTCHGQAFQVPVTGDLQFSRLIGELIGRIGNDPVLASAGVGPALRPPTA